MKQVEFDIELVKKIQSGEVKGRVLTRCGMNARFLGEIIDDIFPLAFAIKIDDEEKLEQYSIDGKYSLLQCSNKDIIIEIEEPKQECQFKPFDKVLVRDEDNGNPWISVEERLPENYVEVIGMTKRGWVLLIWRNDKEWCGEEYRDLLCPDITHWMPIPELKKGE